jgi:hypothetical protein
MYLLPLVGMKDLSLKKSPVNDGTRRKIIRQMKTTTTKTSQNFTPERNNRVQRKEHSGLL